MPELEYPLDYTFKVIGLAADDFPEHARRIVARFVEGVTPDRVRTRASSAGKYHSVSVVAWLVSEEQRKAVYLALHEDERVVHYL